MPMATPFASFTEMQQQHTELRKQSLQPASDAPQLTAASVRNFLARGKITGAIISEENDRKSAQVILDFWSAELASSPDAIRSDFVPVSLDASQTEHAPVAPANNPKTASTTSAERPSEAIRLAALARQWRTTKQAGYLLTDKKSIEQAKEYEDFDQDIALLVAASESARFRNLFARVTAFAIIFGLIVGLGFIGYFLYVVEEAKSELALIEINYRATEKRLIETNQKQAETIKELEEKLRDAKISSERNVADTAIPDLVAAIAEKDRTTKQPTSQDGFIWIGAGDAAKSNIGDMKTGTPIAPQNAAKDRQYRIIRNNLVFRKGLPDRDTYTMTESLGVVPEGTLVTALEPATGITRKGDQSYWLKVRVQTSAPIVFFQYTTTSVNAARKFAYAVGDQGFRIAGVEETKLASGLSAVRYYYKEDEQAANKLADAALATFTSLGYKVARPKVESYEPRRGERNFPGVMELWLDLPELK